VDPGVLLQALVSGLAAGAVLGLVALGFTLVAGTVRVLNLAHGDIVVAAVFTGVLVVLGRTPVATSLAPGSAIGFALLVLAAGAVLSGTVGWLAVRPNLPDAATGRAGDVLGWVAGLVAAGLLLREVLGLLFPQEAYAVPDPFRLDVRRENASSHLAFGFGRHFCLGAHLARMEIRAIFRELLGRLDHIELAGEPTWIRANFVQGPKSIPITYRLH